ncbi:hypothetical protein VZT92_005763 [Zoarces viviparus]|uniref:Uncharacterized protein n=1 Tax=Zoarces viviparus TaxID=48416 RepID=A0AAW1FRG6_ZOAVI
MTRVTGCNDPPLLKNVLPASLSKLAARCVIKRQPASSVSRTMQTLAVFTRPPVPPEGPVASRRSSSTTNLRAATASCELLDDRG